MLFLFLFFQLPHFFRLSSHLLGKTLFLRRSICKKRLQFGNSFRPGLIRGRQALDLIGSHKQLSVTTLHFARTHHQLLNLGSYIRLQLLLVCFQRGNDFRHAFAVLLLCVKQILGLHAFETMGFCSRLGNTKRLGVCSLRRIPICGLVPHVFLERSQLLQANIVTFCRLLSHSGNLLFEFPDPHSLRRDELFSSLNVSL